MFDFQPRNVERQAKPSGLDVAVVRNNNMASLQPIPLLAPSLDCRPNPKRVEICDVAQSWQLTLSAG